MELDKLLLQESLDVKLLLQQSRTIGGFLTNSLRRKIWPKLLGIERYGPRVRLVDGAVHRDKEQCECDVERSFHSIVVSGDEDHLSSRKIENRRKILSKIIMTVLVKHPDLYYYQGLNDVFSIIILIVEDESLAYKLCEAIAIKYLADYMQPDFKHVASIMTLIFTILEKVDPELFKFVRQSEVQPFFATSWIVTWLSHDVKDVNQAARIFDAILASIPLYSIYLSTAIMVHFRDGVLQCSPDMPSVHSFLANLVRKKSFPIEAVISLADTLLDTAPPSEISKIGQNMTRSFFRPQRVYLLELHQPIARYLPSDWKQSTYSWTLPSTPPPAVSLDVEVYALKQLLVGDCARPSRLVLPSLLSNRSRREWGALLGVLAIVGVVLLSGSGGQS